MTHADWIAIGSGILVPLILFHVKTWWKIDSALSFFKGKFAVEHEILVDYMCEQKSKDLGRPFTRNDLPTRHPNVPF